MAYITKKITTSRQFDILGTICYNIIPPYIINLPNKLFNKKISQWLMESLDELVIE